MNEKEIQDFNNYLLLERGYSENTAINYLSDISDLVDFIKESEIVPDLLHLERKKHAEFFISHLMEKDLTSKSVSRKISSIRTFYKTVLYINIINIQRYKLSYTNTSSIN